MLFPAKCNIYIKKNQPNETFLHIYLPETYAALQGEQGQVGEESPPPALVLVPKNPFKDVFDNTCDISDFRAHIYCPQTTQELPEKHYEAGRPDDAY